MRQTARKTLLRRGSSCLRGVTGAFIGPWPDCHGLHARTSGSTSLGLWDEEQLSQILGHINHTLDTTDANLTLNPTIFQIYRRTLFEVYDARFVMICRMKLAIEISWGPAGRPALAGTARHRFSTPRAFLRERRAGATSSEFPDCYFKCINTYRNMINTRKYSTQYHINTINTFIPHIIIIRP
jgi:hypothetical protein